MGMESAGFVNLIKDGLILSNLWFMAGHGFETPEALGQTKSPERGFLFGWRALPLEDRLATSLWLALRAHFVRPISLQAKLSNL
ncbi:MAG: hypothetical protein A3E57_01400 [Candidatus Muproteobacteria bacterium RIFCSPHIGHO2_12_FULL_60_33]|uniref:Uncharacterized protein n=1 Tax=Candidatus Muproteobacteria bacterium RIFCSPLOWO2_01_FULL_60_18 TaxID=1817768 RepID=A0A1F6U161_9PROT|nr:MAG: hypothetical protein A3A87_00030 [Candidatus Muproteobacteria bacterium RIFCSPLOWO2_01_FULL_60_18]OGI51112.1 MAG: hypothetical protein A2W42_05175 [Candidatus Muproteobacteria bacterium RIFCSPHIGHO2_01_60_12]OGI53937.1 MAG: hypothetical protein A3E57_01400 [Candidatus Muproteobacteria bacterium RIFCSPHIGHO2_12_FULL_60_33]